MAAADGQIRSELVGATHSHRRVYLGRMDLWCGSIPRRRAVNDRPTQPSVEVFLDLDVESDYTSDTFLHSVL